MTKPYPHLHRNTVIRHPYLTIILKEHMIWNLRLIKAPQVTKVLFPDPGCLLLPVTGRAVLVTSGSIPSGIKTPTGLTSSRTEAYYTGRVPVNRRQEWLNTGEITQRCKSARWSPGFLKRLQEA